MEWGGVYERGMGLDVENSTAFLLESDLQVVVEVSTSNCQFGGGVA